MVAITRTPRHRWIEQGLRALADGGPDAVRVETLAQSLGVSKGGFYGHFADRAALLTEMLDAWETMSTDDVLRRVEDRGGDARAKIRRPGRRADVLRRGTAAGRPGDPGVGPPRPRRGPAVAPGDDNARMTYLRQLFGAICADEAEAEARSLLAFSLLIGQHFLAADPGARSRAEQLDLAGRWLLA